MPPTRRRGEQGKRPRTLQECRRGRGRPNPSCRRGGRAGGPRPHRGGRRRGGLHHRGRRGLQHQPVSAARRGRLLRLGGQPRQPDWLRARGGSVLPPARRRGSGPHPPARRGGEGATPPGPHQPPCELDGAPPQPAVGGGAQGIMGGGRCAASICICVTIIVDRFAMEVCVASAAARVSERKVSSERPRMASSRSSCERA